MAHRIEVSLEEAIRAAASCPWSGQIAESVYVRRYPALDRGGEVVSLTAVWEGAERLSGDPTVRCIVLEKNPNLVGFKDCISLRIDRANGKGRNRLEYVCREGVAPLIGEDEQDLVQTVLGNITKLAVQS